MPGSSNILVTSFFVFWLCKTTKIIFYFCLLTHFARQDRQNRNSKNNQNHATKVTKIPKYQKPKLRKWYEPNIRKLKSWNMYFEINQSLKEMNTQKNLAMKNILMKLKTRRMQNPMKVLTFLRVTYISFF